MMTCEQQRQQAWKEYIEENPLCLIDALQGIRVNGVGLDSRSKEVLEELIELLCEPEYVPQRKSDFPKEFSNAVHAAAMRLCAECSGNILRREDVEDLLKASNHKPVP